MARRSPSAVRAALDPHPRRSSGSYSSFDRVSPDTLREIRAWERARGRPGEVAEDLAWWNRQAALMCSRRWRGLGHEADYSGSRYWCPCCDYDQPRGRWGLEEVLQFLSRRARREFAAVVGAADARVLAATYGGESDEPGWWEQRM